MLSKSRRGQVFVPDFIASIGLFAAILLFTGILWNSSIINFSNSYDASRKQNKYTLDLLTTSGSPNDWNESNVEIIGFSKTNTSEMSAEKFLEFKNISKSKKRELLRTQEFLVSFRRLDGTVAEYEGQKLRYKSSEIPKNKTIYSSKKPVILKKGKIEIASKLVFFTWEG